MPAPNNFFMRRDFMPGKPFVKNSYVGKESGANPRPRPLEDFRDIDFESRARQVLDSAVQKAAQMERQAYEAGFAKGEQAGIELGQQKMMPVLERLQGMLDELSRSRESMLVAMEGKIAKLAVAIAEKIVHITIDSTSEVVKATVRESINQSVDRGKLEVHVSPGEYEVIKGLKPDILNIEGVDSVSVISDPDIKPGGCRIITSVGGVDGRVETALKELKNIAN